MRLRFKTLTPRASAAQAVVACLLLVTGASSVAFADVNEAPIDSVNSHSQASITAGSNHACALLETGGVKCWGYNAKGQLGDGTFVSKAPVQVQGLTSGITAIAAGSNHTCVLTTVGGVKCWGANSGGQVGDGTTTDQSSPVQVEGLTSGVTAVTAGGTHTCALLDTGSVKCWGYNGSAFRVLGDVGTVERWLEPTQVDGLATGVAAISASAYHTCALMNTGGVKCWGRNGNGQLGNGLAQQSNTVVQVSELTSGVAAIALGYAHSCALMIDGTAKCWGWNSFGQTGSGTTADQLSPVSVIGLSGVVLSLSLQSQSTCALITGGSVECWGVNGWTGGLGDGTEINRLSPTQVSGLTSGITAITAGDYFGCALSNISSLKCWGDNQSGQISLPLQNPVTSRKHLTPFQVVGLSTGVGLTTTTTTTTTSTTTTTVAPTSSSTTTSAAPTSSSPSTSAVKVVTAATTTPPEVTAQQETIATTTTAPVGQGAIPRISTTTTAPASLVGTASSTTELSRATTTSVPDEAPSVVEVDSGSAVVRVGEKNQDSTIERVENQFVVRSGTMRTAVSVVDDNGDVQELDADGNVRIISGGKLRVSMTGFEPDAEIELWLFSTPTLLGRAAINVSGAMSSDFALPRSLESGQHRVAIVSGTTESTAVTITVGIMAGAWSQDSGITLWFIVAPLALAVSGALILPATRRRRRARL